jgi:hypothetical protein
VKKVVGVFVRFFVRCFTTAAQHCRRSGLGKFNRSGVLQSLKPTSTWLRAVQRPEAGSRHRPDVFMAHPAPAFRCRR